MQLMFASRVARREVRRRPARTFLVALLVAVPALAFVVLSTIGLTASRSTDEQFRDQYGSADIVITPDSRQSDADVVAEIRKILGPDVAISEGTSAWAPMRLSEPAVSRSKRSKVLELRDWGTDDTVLGRTMTLLAGRSVRAADEVVLSPSLARAWQVTVGDTLAFSIPDESFRVVGIMRQNSGWNINFMVVRSVSGLAEFAQRRFMVDAPTEMTWERFRTEHPDVVEAIDMNRALSAGVDGTTGSSVEDSGTVVDVSRIWASATFVDGGPNGSFSSTRSNPWSAILLILEFAVVSVVIAAAFATSARRQLVTLGQLGANGAPARMLQISLALQGMWSGIVGVIVAGVAYGLSLATGHGLVERMLAKDVGQWRIPTGSLVMVAVVAILSSTCAAWLPARTAARTGVLDALAGRSHLRNVPRLLLPWGIALCVAGTGLEFLVALGVRGDNSSENTSTWMFAGALGGLAILAGVCCLGPVIVSVFGPVGARSGGALRLTARSLARGRARSAAVVVAIAAFVAMGLTASTGFVTSRDNQRQWMSTAPNVVALWGVSCPGFRPNGGLDQSTTIPCRLADPLPTATSSVRDTMVGTRPTPLRWATFDPSPWDDTTGTASTDARSLPVRDPGGLLVADSAVMKAIALSDADRREFEKTGVMYVSDPKAFTQSQLIMNPVPWFDAATRTVRVNLKSTSGTIRVNAYVNRDGMYSVGSELLITESRASQIGLPIRTSGEIFVQGRSLSDWQRAEIQFVSMLTANLPQGLSLQTPIAVGWQNPGVDSRLVEMFITAAVLAVTLLIVAIGLSLMAAEGRDERDVLVAIGSPPRTLSSVAALRAFLLSMCGVAIAVPVGLIPVSVVLSAGNSHADARPSVVVPWLTIVLLFAVPFLVYATTLIVSWVARVLRPVRMSNFAFE